MLKRLQSGAPMDWDNNTSEDNLKFQAHALPPSAHLADAQITLKDLAAEFNVSRERVRQIETRAFEKVRHAAQKHFGKTPTSAGLCAQ